MRHAAAAAAIAVAATGAGIAVAGTPGPAPRALYYCAISGHGAPVQWLTSPSRSGCPAGMSQYVLGAQGPQGAPGANGTSYQLVTASAQTDITSDQDSGNHGDWATDTLVRQTPAPRPGQVAVADCGGTAVNGITSCWYYTAIMTDTGTFTTDAGASSPNAGKLISGQLSGTIAGGSSYELYASSGKPDAALVPATLDAASAGTHSSAWPERFFPAGTAFGSGPNEINWSYSYNAPATCETWVDAYDNGDGGQPGDGDITGVNACKA